MSPFILDPIVLWLLVPGLIVVFGAAILAGYRYGESRRATKGEAGDHTGAALTAMLTLVGFLIAFTFSLAGSNFDTRRELVINEANAISGTFAAAEFLQEPQRSTIQDLLVEYAELRASFDAFEGSQSLLDDFVRQSEDLQEQILVAGTEAAALDPNPLTATFVGSHAELIDIHNLRTDLRWNRIPPAVFLTLLVLSLFAMVLVGYVRGLSGNMAPIGTVLLLLTYVIVFLVILDLDRHTSGIFSVSQQPVVEVRDSLLSR